MDNENYSCTDSLNRWTILNIVFAFPIKNIAKKMKRRPELKIAKWMFDRISMVLRRPAE